MWFIKRKSSLTPPATKSRWVTTVQGKMRWCAEKLGKETAPFSKRKWTVVLVLFTLVFGFFSVAVVYSALVQNPKKNSYVLQPVPIQRIPLQKRATPSRISERDMNRVARLERYLDSLPPYQKDSLMRLRPGLFDTVAHLKRLYAEQVGSDSNQVFYNPK